MGPPVARTGLQVRRLDAAQLLDAVANGGRRLRVGGERRVCSRLRPIHHTRSLSFSGVRPGLTCSSRPNDTSRPTWISTDASCSGGQLQRLVRAGGPDELPHSVRPLDQLASRLSATMDLVGGHSVGLRHVSQGLAGRLQALLGVRRRRPRRPSQNSTADRRRTARPSRAGRRPRRPPRHSRRRKVRPLCGPGSSSSFAP